MWLDSFSTAEGCTRDRLIRHQRVPTSTEKIHRNLADAPCCKVMRRDDLLLDIALIAAAVYRQPGGFICRFRALDGLLLSHDCELCYSSYGVLSSVCIPDIVRELCDGCLCWCWSLRRVMFGSSSLLEWIEFRAFPKSVSY